MIPRAITMLLCTVLQICFGTVYAWSFFQTLLVKQYGWSFTDTAVAFSIAIFSLGLSAAWAGAQLPRVGPRRLALAGSVMFSGGYLIAGLALHFDFLLLFYLGYGVIGGAGIGLGYVTPVATIVKWFPDRKGLATGVVVMGFGMGAFLLSKVLAPLLVLCTAGELPFVFVWLGFVFACLLVPSSLAFERSATRLRQNRRKLPGWRGSGGSRRVRFRCPLSSVARVRDHVARILFQHHCRDLRHKFSVVAAAGCLGTCRSYGGAGDACGVWGDADRCEFVVQRCGAAVLGIAFGPHRACTGIQNTTRQPDGCLWDLDDGT